MIFSTRFHATWILGALLLLETLSTSCASKDNPTAPSTGSVGATPVIAGVVLLPRGTTAARAEVRIFTDPRSAGGLNPYSAIDTTSPAGEFAFQVPAGTYDLLAGIRSSAAGPLQPGYDSLVSFQSVSVASRTRPLPAVHLMLQPSGAFRGQTTYAGSTRPSSVSVFCPALFNWADVDTVGPFLLPGIPPGTWQVVAGAFTDTSVSIVFSAPLVMPGAGDTVLVPDLQLPGLSVQRAGAVPVGIPGDAWRALLRGRTRGSRARASLLHH